MPGHVLPVVPVKRLDQLDSILEDRQVDDKGRAPARDDVLGDRLVGPRIAHLPKVGFFWQHECLHFVVSELACIEVNDKFLFKMFDFNVV
jgi:hypothetical protein